jgi:hypothetical protein
MPGLTYWDQQPPSPLRMSPEEWEAEAVDYIPVEVGKLSKKDLLSFAVDARAFIFRTMAQMEVRPRRSYLRRLAKKKGKK